MTKKKTKKYREKKLGSTAIFLLPSLKLKRSGLEKKIHKALIETYGGFTVNSGSMSGYWLNDQGELNYSEHLEFVVITKRNLRPLKSYLAQLARELQEECIYLQVEGRASFIYA